MNVPHQDESDSLLAAKRQLDVEVQVALGKLVAQLLWD